MEQPHLVAAMAAKLLNRHGSKSLETITQHCAMAKAIGDQSSLQMWLDIAAATEGLLLIAAPHGAVGQQPNA